MADTETRFDLIVIGAGPGGYVAAIRAAQLGMKVACIDKRDALGGTCLNVGCIPSKALLHATEKLEEATGHFAELGITVSGVKADLAAMQARKAEVVRGLTEGIAFLFKKNKVTWLKGKAEITAPGKVVLHVDGKARDRLEATSILIATGSDVARLPGVEIDEKRVLSSTGALGLTKVPKRLVVIGGGYIGLEMGSVWRRLGSEVTVVEFLETILPAMDGELARQMHRQLERQGMAFRLGTKVLAARSTPRGVILTVAPAKGGDSEELRADAVLLAIGRTPYTHGLGLKAVGVAMDERGFITVDSRFQTSVPGIHAVGDVIPGPMLAHKAMQEGETVAEILAGQKPSVNYDAIPGVVYTHPEAATVGKTEEQLKQAGIAYRVGKFPFQATPRARTNGDADGFVKILADAATDRILGAHILGPDAGTLIAELALAMEFGASAEDLARTCHAHPTLNEAVKEAALAVAGHPIHL